MKWIEKIKYSRYQEKMLKKVRKQTDRLVKQDRLDELFPYLTAELDASWLSNPAKADLLIYMASRFKEKGDAPSAATGYDMALQLVKQKEFEYHKELQNILNVFRYAGREDLVEEWRTDFHMRASYDKKFKDLT